MTSRQFVKIYYPNAKLEYEISPSFMYNGQSWYVVYSDNILNPERILLTDKRCSSPSMAWLNAKHKYKKDNLNAF